MSVEGCGNFKYAQWYDEKVEEEFQYAIFIYDRGKASNDGTLNDNNRKDINLGIKKLDHTVSYISPCWWENCRQCSNPTNLCNHTEVEKYISYSDEKWRKIKQGLNFIDMTGAIKRLLNYGKKEQC